MWANYAKVPFHDLVAGWSDASHHLLATQVWTWSNWRLGTNARPKYRGESLAEYPFYKDHNVVGIRLQARGDWAKNGLNRYLAAKRMWDASADVDALVRDFVVKMFPSAPDEFGSLIALYDRKGRKEISWEKFLRDGVFLLDLIRRRISTPDEKKRWQFYALYLHEQVLERAIDRCKDEQRKIELYKEMVAFLKGVQHIGIVESRQLIRTPCWGSVRKLGYEPKGRSFDEVPAMRIDEKSVMALYERDRQAYPRSISTVVRRPLRVQTEK